MKNIAWMAVALMLAAAACAKSTAPEALKQAKAPPGEAAATQAALTNPTSFPLADQSKILDVKHFSQTVSAGSKLATGLMSQGAGTYTGDEVIAASPQSLDDLKNWLHGLASKPPEGFTHETDAVAKAGEARAIANKNGIDFAFFRAGAANKGVLVVVMDPKAVNAKMGVALGLVDKYQALPTALKQGIDNQLKQRAGFSIAEATDPASPVGGAISALKEFSNSESRAILVVEAEKK